MSNHAINWALNQATSDPTTKIVLVALASASDQSGVCRSSVESLSKLIGVGRSSIYRHIASLVESGLIKHQTSSVFVLLLPKAESHALDGVPPMGLNLADGVPPMGLNSKNARKKERKKESKKVIKQQLLTSGLEGQNKSPSPADGTPEPSPADWTKPSPTGGTPSKGSSSEDLIPPTAAPSAEDFSDPLPPKAAAIPEPKLADDGSLLDPSGVVLFDRYQMEDFQARFEQLDRVPHRIRGLCIKWASGRRGRQLWEAVNGKLERDRDDLEMKAPAVAERNARESRERNRMRNMRKHSDHQHALAVQKYHAERHRRIVSGLSLDDLVKPQRFDPHDDDMRVAMEDLEREHKASS